MFTSKLKFIALKNECLSWLISNYFQLWGLAFNRESVINMKEKKIRENNFKSDC